MKRAITITKPQAVSEISRDVAQILFASMFVAPLMEQEANLIVVFFGIILSSAGWLLSLSLSRS